MCVESNEEFPSFVLQHTNQPFHNVLPLDQTTSLSLRFHFLRLQQLDRTVVTVDLE